jgi:hypothetical protein
MAYILGIATVIGGLSGIVFFLDKFYDFRKTRPKIEMQFIGDNPPVFCVTVYNRSSITPLHIHHVRVPFGDRAFCYALVLVPETTTSIPPKGKYTFKLPSDSNIVDRVVTRRRHLRPDIPPSFDNPANLFMAIVNGPKNASWIDIQYNEDKHACVMRGKVKQAFRTILDIDNETSLRHSIKVNKR